MDPDEIWSYKLRTRLHVKIDEAMHDHLYTENKITPDMSRLRRGGLVVSTLAYGSSGGWSPGRGQWFCGVMYLDKTLYSTLDQNYGKDCLQISDRQKS